MAPLKALAQGFLATIALILACNAINLFNCGGAWKGLLFPLVLLLTFSGAAVLWLRRKGNPSVRTEPSEKWRNRLFSMQGVALACWIFDLATTYYAVDVTRVAREINPLGWPLGILGALAYYGPTLALSYVLLFKIRERISLYAAFPMTAVAVGMGLMNLHAGTLNLEVFMGTSSLAAEIGYGSLALLLIVGFLFQRLFVKQPCAAFKS